MVPTLYFLRSSEQYIISKMLPIAYRLDILGKTLEEYEELRVLFGDFYGYTNKDLGLYAMVNNEVVGAIWSRKINNSPTPTISLAVVPKYRGKGIAKAMLEQFLLEAATLYEKLEVELIKDSKAIELYQNYGFLLDTNYKGCSLVDKKETIKLFKTLQKQELQRPSDEYDSRRWMDP